jgi:hypothetical protein
MTGRCGHFLPRTVFLLFPTPNSTLTSHCLSPNIIMSGAARTPARHGTLAIVGLLVLVKYR